MRGAARLEGKLIGFWLFTLAVRPAVRPSVSAVSASQPAVRLSLAAELAENECTSLISSLTWKLWYLSLQNATCKSETQTCKLKGVELSVAWLLLLYSQELEEQAH